MAETVLAITARKLPDLETEFDSAFSTILTSYIEHFEFTAQDFARARGIELRITATISSGAGAITHPYKLKVFDGKTVASVATQANAFITANPTYWFAAGFLASTDQSRRDKPIILVLPYSEDITDGNQNWQAGGASLTLAGDVTGPLAANTVEKIRNTTVTGAPSAGGQQMVYDGIAGTLEWYSLPVYTSLANAAADQANQIIGARIVIYGSAGGAEDGTYQVDAKTGVVGDYTKISDHTDTASEVLIVDAGGYFASDNVEGALQEIGASVAGGLSYAGLTAGTTVIDSLAIATYRGATWEVTTDDGAGNVEIITVQASHDGTTAQYTVTGPGPQGTVPVTASVIVNGANLELSLTITGAATWGGRVLRRPVLL